MLLFFAVAMAGCPARPAELAEEVDRARAAFQGLDRVRLADAALALREQVACLGTDVDPALAAEVHEVQGLAAFVAGDEDAAALAFASARRADPAWRPDPKLIPRGHPVQALSTRVQSQATVGVPAPSRGELSFDGAPGLARPSDAPTIAVWVVDGEVRRSAWLPPEGAMIPYDRPGVAASTSNQGVSGALRPALWGVAAGAALASAGSFYLAADARRDWEASSDVDEVRALYTRNHLWTGAGGVLLLVGGGAAVGAAVSGSF